MQALTGSAVGVVPVAVTGADPDAGVYGLEPADEFPRGTINVLASVDPVLLPGTIPADSALASLGPQLNQGQIGDSTIQLDGVDVSPDGGVRGHLSITQPRWSGPALGAEPLGLYRWMLRLKIDSERPSYCDSVGSSPPQIQDELLPRNIVGARGGVEDATARGRMGYVRQLFGDPS